MVANLPFGFGSASALRLRAFAAEVERCSLRPEEVPGEPEDAFTHSTVEALRRDDVASDPEQDGTRDGLRTGVSNDAETPASYGPKGGGFQEKGGVVASIPHIRRRHLMGPSCQNDLIPEACE
jgi:hypothetical protein